MLGLFAQLGKSRKDSEHRMDVPTFQSRLSAMPVRAQYTLQQALAGLAAQAPDAKPDKPMLLKLAEHVAIRFALDSYEKGELRVNAVKQLLDRMNTEIEALRKILSTQEEMMSQAGLSVQSYTELLDQEFWEQVPEENKKEVLTSDEAWCVPPRNVRAFLEDMLRRGELKTVNEVLMKYASCVGLEAPEARRTTAIGLGLGRTVRQRRRQRFDGGDSPLGQSVGHRARAGIADAGQCRVCEIEPGGGLQALLSGDAASTCLARERGGAETGVDTEPAASHRRGRTTPGIHRRSDAQRSDRRRHDGYPQPDAQSHDPLCNQSIRTLRIPGRLRSAGDDYPQPGRGCHATAS